MTASQDPEIRSPQPGSAAGEPHGSRDGEYRLPDAQVSGGRLTGAPRSPRAPESAAPRAAAPPPATGPVAFTGSPGQVWVEPSPAGRPRAVTIACALGVADVVIAFVMLGARLATTDDLIVQAMGEADAFLPNDGDISGVYYGVTTGLIALYALLAAVWGLLVLFMGRGRSWARVTLTTVAFVWAVSTLLSLVGTRSPGQLLTSLEVVQAVALVATMVCMHVASTRDHFSGHG
ncbi:hypothetical protein GCM10027271_13900 [Saccharopolyspora gloriosae]|uniref:Uncharacterized protein n=1 Tax=Saccharopolyspora gloriosae TaxID=455344 RepID=A0A840N5M2_9PSEU|nr:hypothetical protein [Saccharopolyspora gloriosae]MBB5066944.1 hypothetical protein [Saccharopolyspora gloriosae]